MSDDKNVIQFPQQGGTPPDDILNGLPELPAHLMFCGNCGKHADEVKNTKLTGWCISPDGCGDCLTAREIRFLDQRNEAWSSWGEVTRDHAHLLAAARTVVHQSRSASNASVQALRRMIDMLDENKRRYAEAVAAMLERREAHLAKVAADT